MLTFNSLDEIRLAFETEDPETVMYWASNFWRQAAVENREDAKQLLMEIADNFPDLRSSCFAWLHDFPDPTLALFFLKYIRDEHGDTAAIYALMEFGQKGVLGPDDPSVVKPLMELLALDQKATNEPVLAALLALKAASAIDLIAGFLDHPHPAIRMEAMRCVILLSRLAHRDDLLEKAVPFLNDPHPATRLAAAINLKKEYPERFPDIDVNKYIDDVTNPKK